MSSGRLQSDAPQAEVMDMEVTAVRGSGRNPRTAPILPGPYRGRVIGPLAFVQPQRGCLTLVPVLSSLGLKIRPACSEHLMTQLGALLDSLTHCKRSTSASLICLGISKGSLEEQSGRRALFSSLVPSGRHCHCSCFGGGKSVAQRG